MGTLSPLTVPALAAASSPSIHGTNRGMMALVADRETDAADAGVACEVVLDARAKKCQHHEVGEGAYAAKMLSDAM